MYCALLSKHHEGKTVDDVMDAFTAATFGPPDAIPAAQPHEGGDHQRVVMVDDVTGVAMLACRPSHPKAGKLA